MIRRFLSLSQTERDAIYEQESSNTVAQQHCTDRLTLLSNDNTLVRPQEQDKHNNFYTQTVVGRYCLRKNPGGFFYYYLLPDIE